MTGLPDFNAPAFNRRAADLRGQGFDVFNPVDNGLPADSAWEAHMRADIMALCECGTILMLPGWSRSRGAALELHVAVALGLRVVFDSDA